MFWLFKIPRTNLEIREKKIVIYIVSEKPNSKIERLMMKINRERKSVMQEIV